MNRYVLPALALLVIFASACAEPQTGDVKVIVGATLINGDDPPIAHSVVLVRDDRISAVGPQQSTPIPAGSEKVNGLGKYVVAAKRGARLEAGVPADLLLLSANPLESPANYDKVERRMVAGKWVDK
jgi:imidazolonepropionase-like amidohydrolase